MQAEPVRKPSPRKIRAYKQAPWRAQTRLLTIGLALVFGIMAVIGLFVFTGAQAAEAGLRVQSLIHDRDQLLRRIETQEGALARAQSVAWMRQRAAELGFVPATAADVDYLEGPAVPPPDSVYVSPTSYLYTEEKVSISPAYKETLLEWLLRAIRPGGGG